MEQPETKLRSDGIVDDNLRWVLISGGYPVDGAPVDGAQIAREPCEHAAAGAAAQEQPVLAAPTSNYIYALGRIEPHFPTLGIEKEFAQAMGRAPTAGLTDLAALKTVLSERSNRYLVWKLCWVLTIDGLETYILQPRDPADFDLLLDTLRAAPRATDVNVVIGVRGPIAPPQLCNGMLVPIVRFSQLYSFDVDSFAKSIPRPAAITEEQFIPVAEEVFSRIMQMADNTGAMDQHRALNYLATRYQAIYATTAEAHSRNNTLTAINVRPPQSTGVRKVVEVVFSYTNRQTDVTEKFFTRVDVTEEFPFLVTKMSPYYDR